MVGTVSRSYLVVAVVLPDFFSLVWLFGWWMQSSLLLDVSNCWDLSLSRGKNHSVANSMFRRLAKPIEKVMSLSLVAIAPLEARSDA